MSPSAPVRPSWPHFALSLFVLAGALVPLTGRAKTIRESLRSLEPNKAERESNAAGYYEGLIGVETGQGARGELSLRLLGKPTEWVRFQAGNVSRQLPGDFLAFELRPNLSEVLFGRPFTTNSHGLRDREYPLKKPAGVTRIVVLGASIDMGWGIGTDETYANLLEDWLNLHAARHGLGRRYEVINCAVAAYGPAQRVEMFRRKGVRFEPDLVLYSATMLDSRLAEIHLSGLLQGRVDLKYDALRRAVDDAGVTEADLVRDVEGNLAQKNVLKRKLNEHFWRVQDAVFGELAADCRSLGIPLGMVLIPRAGKSDAPDARAEPVAKFKAVAERHAVPTIDLTSAFDKLDPAEVEISAWDNHPNAFGHQRLFLGLARALAARPEFHAVLFSPAAAAAASNGTEP